MNNLFLFSFHSFYVDNKVILVTLFVGAIAGLLAQLITPGRGFGLLATLGIGLLGGYLGGLVFKSYLDFSDSALLNAIIRSTAGALILCIAINLIFGSKRKDHHDVDRSGYESGR